MTTSILALLYNCHTHNDTIVTDLKIPCEVYFNFWVVGDIVVIVTGEHTVLFVPVDGIIQFAF
jgi:hypothetical protein